MIAWLTPRRRRGVEVLDDHAVPDAVRIASMRDVERSNVLFGGTHAVRAAFGRVAGALPPDATLLDVGCGMGDLAAALRRQALATNVALWAAGADRSATLLRTGRARLDAATVADALALPFADDSWDTVLCSQLLHHFEAGDARRLIAELHRVARVTVIVTDLRRSWFAAAGFFASATVLRWHPVTRHDGMTSVLRGFTASELRGLVRDATGREPIVRRHPLFRLSATWRK